MIPRFRFTVPVREDELEGVYRRELSRLLILGARDHQRGCLGTTAYASLLEPVASRWRRRARRHLQLLVRDGWQLEGHQLLAELVAGCTEGGTKSRFGGCTAVEIISLAIELWPAPGHYLALGQALLAGGRAAEAQAVYAFLLQDLHRFEYQGPALRWRIREGLAAAWEAVGKDRVARGCLATCLDDPAAGGGPLVGAFFLALELGHGAEAQELGSRLDARFASSSKRLDSCLSSLAARVEFVRAGRWVPPVKSAATFGSLVREGGSAGRICRRLVGLAGGAA
ncbi:MAG: hypothetical protein H8D72_00070 [Planctomycetes bacterium]|nr:hypothetical protein [Planctomycetota bacterium]